MKPNFIYWNFSNTFIYYYRPFYSIFKNYYFIIILFYYNNYILKNKSFHFSLSFTLQKLERTLKKTSNKKAKN